MKEPRWLREAEVLAIHERLLAEHGGLAGIKDGGLLKSALDKPQNLFTYEKPSIFGMAAASGYGIAKNHPFLDGNKRTALTCAGVFLELNGYILTTGEEMAVVATLELASGKMSQNEFAIWLKQKSEKIQ